MSSAVRRMRRKAVRDATNATLVAVGCNCKPLIEIHGEHAIIRHDEWCRARHLGRTYTLFDWPECGR